MKLVHSILLMSLGALVFVAAHVWLTRSREEAAKAGTDHASQHGQDAMQAIRYVTAADCPVVVRPAPRQAGIEWSVPDIGNDQDPSNDNQIRVEFRTIINMRLNGTRVLAGNKVAIQESLPALSSSDQPHVLLLEFSGQSLRVLSLTLSSGTAVWSNFVLDSLGTYEAGNQVALVNDTPFRMVNNEHNHKLLVHFRGLTGGFVIERT